MPNPDEDELAPLPRFRPPTTPPDQPAETPVEVGTTTRPRRGDSDGPSAAGSDAKRPSGPATPGGQPPGSTPRPPRAKAKDFLEVTGGLVVLASVLVRFVRTRRRQLPEGIWIATDDDKARIGGPLASIAARHAPIDPGDAGDIGDGIGIIVGVAAYALEGFTAEAEFGVPIIDVEEAPDGRPGG
jgi:hypothetical protein